MDYMIENANEIMKLCFGGGFLILVLVACRTLWHITKVVKKINDLTELFIDYIEKPLMMILSAKKILDKVMERFQK